MLIEKVRELSPEQRLLYWIRERESIRIKRMEGKPFPWTDDEILCKFKFCNVRRMDDAVSQWLLKNWYRKYHDHSNMLIACLLARQLNRIETLEAVGFPQEWDPRKVQKVLEGIKEKGEKVFSAAYMITGTLGGTKIEQIVHKVVDALARKKVIVQPSSMEKTWTALKGNPGMQSFMAGQVVADLRWAMTGGWSDRNSWAPLGPGSKRGLNRLCGFSPLAAQPLQEFKEMLEEATQMLQKKVHKSISERLEAMDYQNCLCEFDKYSRVLNGEGRPKQIFRSRS